MTRDEAIMILKNEQPHCGKRALFSEEKKYEAYDMAIKALEQQTCEDAVSREAVLMELGKYLCGVPFDEKGIDEVIKELPSVNPTEKQTCEDAISRREAIKMFKYNYKGERIPDYDCDNFPVQIAVKTVKEILRDLPPVNPQQRLGHWIRHVEDWEWWECSECHSTRAYGNEYCPDCGSHNGDVRKRRDEE